MKFSDELKSKELLEFENLVLQCNPATNSVILSTVETGKFWGLTSEREEWIGGHLGVRVVHIKPTTIIQFEDAIGRRLPRWCIEQHYYYFIDGNRAYQMTAYLNAAKYKEMDIRYVNELGYKHTATMLVYNNGLVDNYATTVTYIDMPMLRDMNRYCKAVNRYLRVAAAMENMHCEVQGLTYNYTVARLVATAFTNQEPAHKAALDVVQEMQGRPVMQLLSASHVYKASPFAPTTNMRFLYVRQ